MMREQVMILGAIQVDDPANRAFARLHRAQGIPWPVPYKNSVPASCASCSGAVWLGPEQQQAQRRIITAGNPPPLVLCLLCCYLTGLAAGANLMSLSSKGPGE